MKAKAAIGELLLRVVLILALVVGLAPLAEAQTLAAKGKPAAAKTKSQASAKPSGGPQEGIKVHGHWTIVVRDLDGKEVTRREFENALTNDGKVFLAQLLARQVSVGEWAIQLGGPQGVMVALMFEPNRTVFPGASNTLTVNFIPTGTVEVKGNARAMVSSTITSVETNTTMGGGGVSQFTQTSLQSPVSVSAGQLIEVTVVLSFS